MSSLPDAASPVEQRLSAYFDQLGTVLWDSRQRHCFAIYAIGLMSELERKSLEPIAASLTDDPKTAQRLHHRLQKLRGRRALARRSGPPHRRSLRPLCHDPARAGSDLDLR